MRERTADKVTIFKAHQNYQHKQCYKLETTTSLKILRSLQSRTSIGNVCQENLSNLNKVIDRQVSEVYQKEKQSQGYISGFLQTMLSHFSNQAQMEQEQHQHDSSDEWLPDDEDYQEEEDEDDSMQQK